jgi:glycosyltransferase involved in cell wall biosynthesis
MAMPTSREQGVSDLRPVRPRLFQRPQRLRIAMLAPPWITIPPSGYGGIELVIAELAGGLVRRGHDVTLMAAPGSKSTARVMPLLERAHPERIGDAMVDADHVSMAIAAIDDAGRHGHPFDLVHDHSGFTLVAVADRIDVPVLHTVHGPFTPEATTFYSRHADKVWMSVLSHAQLESGPSGARCVGAIPNPIDLRAWPLECRKDGYLLWIGRMDDTKGAHRAIAVAQKTDMPLILAGPVQPGQEEYFETEVRPHVDGERIRYVDEVGGRRKQELFAHAEALLMPIRWAEPFGMVMVEAMACGTPVIAFPEGSVPEVVVDGQSGFIVSDEDEMAAAVARLDRIDPERCRATVAERFDVDVVTGIYEAAYRHVIAMTRRDLLARGLPVREVHEVR